MARRHGPGLLAALVLAACLPGATSQRAFKISSDTCTLTDDATQCDAAATGDAALKVVFNAGAARVAQRGRFRYGMLITS